MSYLVIIFYHKAANCVILVFGLAALHLHLELYLLCQETNVSFLHLSPRISILDSDLHHV